MRDNHACCGSDPTLEETPMKSITRLIAVVAVLFAVATLCHAQDVKPTDLGKGDLTGVFCTSGSEREFTLEGSWYADEEIQAGTDRDVVAAGDRKSVVEGK